MIVNLIALLVAYVGMEFVAWSVHKYVMHGFLWSLHKTHHQKGRDFFEKNDWYFIFFAVLGSGFMLWGVLDVYSLAFYIGSGITLYGFTYLIVHDIIIHQRIRWLSKLDHPYTNALRRAHRAHHANIGKEGGVSFGMLWVDARYHYRKNQEGRTIQAGKNQNI
jgi:beta-carotene 3-hydroxylase